MCIYIKKKKWKAEVNEPRDEKEVFSTIQEKGNASR